MLHTINKSPFTSSALSDCLRICSADAAIILIEDGVYAVLIDSESAHQLTSICSHVYALAADVAARGLNDRVAPGIELVDYGMFVELCCIHTTIQSWY